MSRRCGSLPTFLAVIVGVVALPLTAAERLADGHAAPACKTQDRLAAPPRRPAKGAVTCAVADRAKPVQPSPAPQTEGRPGPSHKAWFDDYRVRGAGLIER